jgi:hypothetical protein
MIISKGQTKEELIVTISIMKEELLKDFDKKSIDEITIFDITNEKLCDYLIKELKKEKYDYKVIIEDKEKIVEVMPLE